MLTLKSLNNKINTTKINTINAARKSRVANPVSAKVAEAKQIITSGVYAPNAVSARMGDLEQVTLQAAPATSEAFEAFTGAVSAETMPRKGGVSAKIAEAKRMFVSGAVVNETASKFANPAQAEVDNANRIIDFGVNEGKRLSECSEEYLRWAASHLEVFGADRRWVSLGAKAILGARQAQREAKKAA